MQRVVNCILRDRDRVLLLKKPRRGWWVAPGGKMKPTESIMDTLLREYEEETGLQLENARLCGVFTMCVEDDGHRVVPAGQGAVQTRDRSDPWRP